MQIAESVVRLFALTEITLAAITWPTECLEILVCCLASFRPRKNMVNHQFNADMRGGALPAKLAREAAA